GIADQFRGFLGSRFMGLGGFAGQTFPFNGQGTARLGDLAVDGRAGLFGFAFATRAGFIGLLPRRRQTAYGLGPSLIEVRLRFGLRVTVLPLGAIEKLGAPGFQIGHGIDPHVVDLFGGFRVFGLDILACFGAQILGLLLGAFANLAGLLFGQLK